MNLYMRVVFFVFYNDGGGKNEISKGKKANNNKQHNNHFLNQIKLITNKILNKWNSPVQEKG